MWFRAVLGVLGASALAIWPYTRGCGTMLGVYLIGVLAVIAAGVWAMRGAWTHRRVYAFIVGMLVFIAGLGLAGMEALSRTAFAAVRLGWRCH